MFLKVTSTNIEIVFCTYGTATVLIRKVVRAASLSIDLVIFNSSVLYLYINKYACIWVDNIIIINMNVKHNI